jgi:DHA1 family tetracycline resistance protein-like MFS transporter
MPKSVLLTLLTTVFLDFLGFSIVLPYLYFFAQSMGASLFTYGLLVGAYALMQVLCAPLFGKLSDIYGRRYILIFTLIGSAIAYLIFGFTNVLWLVFASRMLGGAFGSTYSIAQAFVADATRKDTRLKYLGYLAGAYGLGYLVGPVIGGSLSAVYGYSAPALFACILAVANACLTYLKFPSASYVGRTVPNIQNPFELIRGFQLNKERYLLLLVNFVSTLVFVFLLVIVPPWLQSIFSFGVLDTGIILSYAGAVSILTVAMVVPRLSKKLSSSALIILGFAIVAVNYFGLSFIADDSVFNVSAMVVFAGLLAFGFSIIGPAVNSLISMTSGSSSQGQTLGFAKSTASLAQVIAPALATSFFSMGISIGQAGFGFLICMLISLLALPLIFLLRRPKYLGTWERLVGGGSSNFVRQRNDSKDIFLEVKKSA